MYQQIVPSDTGATIPGINAANHKAYVLELVWRVADGTLTPTKFAAGVHAAGLPLDSNTNGAATTALAFVVADALWATWILLEGVSDSEPRARLVSLTRDLLLEEGLLPKNILMKVAESELLAEAGVAVDAKTFHRKEIRLHTKLVYAQQKFNLLREDNEGYAKLIAALAAFAAIDKPSENAVAYLVRWLEKGRVLQQSQAHVNNESTREENALCTCATYDDVCANNPITAHAHQLLDWRL